MTAAKQYKVLFISHEAYRTGAPIVLLHLLKWLKKNTALQLDILLLNDGPLKPEFKAIGKTYVVQEIADRYSYPNRIKKKLFNSPVDPVEKVTAKLAANGYDVVYGNTALSLPWLGTFKTAHHTKTICCIHELSYALNHCFSYDYLSQNLPPIDQIIAVSGAVKENLLNTYGLKDEQVALQYEFIDTAATVNDKASPLTADNKTFIIGSGGTPEWRKGADLMVPLAQKLMVQYPDLDFKIAWLGADDENNYGKMIRFDAQKCGVSDKLLFIPPSNNPLDAIKQFDVFVVFSREDPFPLIALEAAFLSKPLIAFENSGGIPELVEQGAGLLASYLDIDALSRHIHQLYTDEQLKHQFGSRGRELILSKYNTDVIAPNIYKLISGLAEKQVS